MNWRNAVAIALTVVAWALRLCAIALCVLTVLLCFSRMAARLGIINLVLDITQALPSVISGYGLMATPMGGVFRLDFAIMAVVLFLLDYLCMFFSRKVR